MMQCTVITALPLLVEYNNTRQEDRKLLANKNASSNNDTSRPPSFLHTWEEWDKEAPLPDKVNFEKTTANGKHLKGRVMPNDGSQGVEYLLSVAVIEFFELESRILISKPQEVGCFRKYLMGKIKTSWDKVCDATVADLTLHLC